MHLLELGNGGTYMECIISRGASLDCIGWLVGVWESLVEYILSLGASLGFVPLLGRYWYTKTDI